MKFRDMSTPALEAYWDYCAKLYKPTREELKLAIANFKAKRGSSFVPMSVCAPLGLCRLLRVSAEGAGLEWIKRKERADSARERNRSKTTANHPTDATNAKPHTSTPETSLFPKENYPQNE